MARNISGTDIHCIAVGRTIQDLRYAAEMTQTSLAIQASVSRRFLGSIENGKRSATCTVVYKIIKAFGISQSMFYKRVDIHLKDLEKHPPRKRINSSCKKKSILPVKESENNCQLSLELYP